MSFSLSGGLTLPTAPQTGWAALLQPASFRGVPFFVDSHQVASGRRLAVHEFPLNSIPNVEDMGRRVQKYRMRAYVLQDQASGNYFSARNDLYFACVYIAGNATLVHPYLGKLTVFCEECILAEDFREGGKAAFDLVFCDSGSQPNFSFTEDTAGSALSALSGILSTAVQIYTLGRLVASRPSILLGAAEGLLGSYVAGVLGLSSAVAAQLASVGGSLIASIGAGGAPVTSAITGATGDPVAVATMDLAVSAAQQILAPPALPASSTVTGQTATLTLMPADPSGGMAAFAGFGASLPPPVGIGAAQAAQAQVMIVDLVRTASVIAVAQIYVNTDWTAADAAAAARDQLLGFLDERILAAASAGQDALYQAWLSLTGTLSADLVQRAQNLPSLAPYVMPMGLPACVVAQALYQDGTRALELAALNHAPHPGFMPQTGLALMS